MKKIITSALLLLSAVAVRAVDYTDSLTVMVNENVTKQNATISVNKVGETYTLSLNNFVLNTGGAKMGVGNIVLAGIQGEDMDGTTYFETSQTVQIAAGTDPSIDAWIGPSLPQVPIVLKAKQNGNRLYALIDIDLQAVLSQTIKVTFGSGYQIVNSDFEAFHKEGTIDEPNSWHSFASVGGTFASWVKGTPHTFISNSEKRPGTSGASSVQVKSTSIFGIVANGTLTTGRMIAGAFSATDKKNHAELDMSSTDKDGHGDPFYSRLNGRPDSLVVWVKFKQGTPNAQYPYATARAVITDGTYYQDPEDKTYTNILAKAENATIESKEAQWQRLSIPFEYVDKTIDGKAILVTLSTNAVPGKGSGNDELYIDDLELVYNSKLNGILVEGSAVAEFNPATYSYNLLTNKDITAADVEAVTNGALVQKTVTPTANGADVVLTSRSADLKSTTVYTLHFTKTTTGISNVPAQREAGAEAVYNLQGSKVQTMQKGQVY
ncbi:MAG TPA: calycin-like domain-containing protein, partial [Prevotella sp.]